ncbi:histone [Streptomyces sp. ME19-03-3]|nr:histone [Streptomyces sp. ME19-03-3]
MRDALRTCLQIAGGLTEATRRRAVGAAKELLDQTGIDVAAVQRSIGERIPPEVQTLADELMASGRANRDLLLGLIREEIDKAMSRVGRLADEVTKVGVVLEALERRVRNLEDGDREHEPAAGGDLVGQEPDAGPDVPPQPPVEHVPVDGPVSTPAAAQGRKPVPADTAGGTPVARKNAAPEQPPATPEPAGAPEASEPDAAVTMPVAGKNAAPAKALAAKQAAPAAKRTAAAKKTATATRKTAKKAAPVPGAPGAKRTTAAEKAAPADGPAAAAGTAAAAEKTATATRKTAKKAAPVSGAPAAKRTAAAEKAAPAEKTAARRREAKGRD